MDRTRRSILLACFVNAAFVGSLWYSFQVFFRALTQDFGWTRAEGALGFSIFILVYGLVGPFTGLATDRFGPRRVVIGGAVLLAAGFAACSLLTTLWQFYLFFGVIAAVGFAACGWISVVTVLQSWFSQRLGSVIGIVSAGVGVGIQLFVPLDQHLIAQIGWRQTYLVVAASTIIIVVPTALVLRRATRAEQETERPAAESLLARESAAPQEAQGAQSWTLALALRSRRYWLLASACFLISSSVQPLMAHQVVYMTDYGVDPFAAATVAGLIGLASVPAKIGWGISADRIGREMTLTLGLIAAAVAVALLWLISQVPIPLLPYAYALMMGVGYAVTAALPSVVAADLFRGRSYGAIYGGLNLATELGIAIGVWLAGAVYDVTGSYGPIFVLALVSMSLGCAFIWLVAPRRVARAPGAASVGAFGR